MSAAIQYIDVCGQVYYCKQYHQTQPIDVKFQMKICDFCETVARDYIQYGNVAEKGEREKELLRTKNTKESVQCNNSIEKSKQNAWNTVQAGMFFPSSSWQHFLLLFYTFELCPCWITAINFPKGPLIEFKTKRYEISLCITLKWWVQVQGLSINMVALGLEVFFFFERMQF